MYWVTPLFSCCYLPFIQTTHVILPQFIQKTFKHDSNSKNCFPFKHSWSAWDSNPGQQNGSCRHAVIGILKEGFKNTQLGFLTQDFRMIGADRFKSRASTMVGADKCLGIITQDSRVVGVCRSSVLWLDQSIKRYRSFRPSRCPSTAEVLAGRRRRRRVCCRQRRSGWTTPTTKKFTLRRPSTWMRSRQETNF